MITPQQMKEIIVNRKLRVEPVIDDNGLDLWTVKSARGERITKTAFPSPELAVEEAEKVLLASEVRSHERLCAEAVSLLSSGEYYIKSKAVTIPHPDNSQRTIESIVFEGIKRSDGSLIVSEATSFLAAAIQLQAIVSRTLPASAIKGPNSNV